MSTIAEAARHLFLSERRFREMLDEGIVDRAPRQGYDLDEVRRQYIEHLREMAAGRAGQGSHLTDEKARLAKEQADNLTMKNAQMRGELIPASEVNAAVMGAFARVKAKLLAIPTKLAPLLVSVKGIVQIKETIADAVNEALAELAETRVAGISEAEGQPKDG